MAPGALMLEAMRARQRISPKAATMVRASPESLIRGRGEMAELVRSFDWGSTVLGPIERWSETLLTSVNLMLASPAPTAIYWGTERVLLYNDAFRPFTGEQHPASLGAAGALVWKESWHLVREQCDAVFATGEVTARENFLFPLAMSGKSEDFYWTYSYVPIYEGGQVAGIYHVTQNTTRDLDNKRMEARRAQAAALDHQRVAAQELLVKLLQWQRETNDPRVVMEAAAEAVGLYLNADRTGFFEMVDDETMRLGVCWTAGELPQLEGEVPTSYLGTVQLQDSRLGLTHAISDYSTDPRTVDADFSAIGVRAGIGVPIIRRSRWQSGFYVHSIEPRQWTEAESAFVREVANQTLEGVELIRSQLAVRESEARLRKILESIDDAVIVVNVEGAITGMNPVAERLTGCEQDEVLGQPLAYVFNVVSESVEGSLLSPDTPMQALLVRRDGRELPIEQSHCPMTDDNGQASGTVFVFRDITHRETTERRVRQAYKMEALGQLTGGIAHDFNNILAIIMGNLELVAEDLEAGSEANERVNQAISSTEKATDLTRRLLAFARQQPVVPVVVDMVHLVSAAAEFMRRSLGPAITLQVDLAEDLWFARVDHSQFENALLNLAVNARDAMPSGGTLRIECANFIVGAARMPGMEIAPGEYVQIAVLDTGHGMSNEARLRATEPFFTTKPVGEGTGLGLSMVYGFLKQSGGYLRIESEPGAGTKVSLYLPRAVSVPFKPAPSRGLRADDPLPRGDERVLIVEDELAIRRTIGYLLHSLGYRVLEAEDGPSALVHLMKTPDIDLLLTDVVLPNSISGPELAVRAKRIQPEAKVIFTSGYTANVLVRDYGMEEGAHLLNKPFHLAALARMLRGVLDEEQVPRAQEL